jgi:PAS domain S-box-containing protein
MANGKVLIHHHNPAALQKISQGLCDVGFSTISSSNPKDTVELARELRPQLLLWGDALSEPAKKAINSLKTSDYGKKLSVIVLYDSNKITQKDIQEAQKLGVDDFFSIQSDFTELKSKIILHRRFYKQIDIKQKKIDRYKDLADTNFNIMLSQGVENLCEIVIDYLLHAYPTRMLLLAIYNQTLSGFDYFNVNTADSKTKINIEAIKKHPVWENYFFTNGSLESQEITNPKLLKILKDWQLLHDKIYQFPMQYKGKSLGILLIALDVEEPVDAAEKTMLSALIQATAYRLTEIRRFYGLDRHGGKEKLAVGEYFQRPSEEEILIFLSRYLMKVLQADYCLYMNYHEGFRFLYPKYLFSGDSEQNFFDKEKSPVLLIRDFPTFDKLLTDKKRVIIDMMHSNAATEIGKLPGFKKFPIKNVVIFLVSPVQAAHGFFVVGRESIIKKFTRQELQDCEQLITQATKALEESQILRQAKLTVKQLERIFDLGSELTLEISLEDVLRRICAAIRRTLGWNVVVLDMKKEYEETVKTVGILGMQESDYKKLGETKKIPAFNDRIELSFELGNSYLFDHKLAKENKSIDAQNEFMKRIGTEWNDNDWLFMPIKSRGKLLGMISLNDPVERLRPNEDRVRSVEYFANQAAVVMENAMLFESLKSSELKYRLLAETMTMGLVTCETTGKIIYINNSLTRLLKYGNPDELLGRKIYDFCQETSIHKLQKELIRTLKDTQEVTKQSEELTGIELDFIAKDEEVIPFMIYTSPFYQHGQRIGFFGVLADLRGQKKIERLKADFNSMIVHDLRSPLNIIQGYVDIVRTEVVGEITDEQKELLTIAKENVYKVLKLIDNFLTASKLEAGHLTIEPEVNSINAVMETLFEHYKVLANEKKINLEKNLDTNIPYLNFDKFRIEQVIRNFLSNALKFTPPQGTITIASNLRKKKNEITGEVDLFAEASVKDTGVGIAQEELGKVFNKYEQTEAGKDAALKGTGLGLAICREIIELHKGEVWVKSTLDKGSTFGFTVPIQSMKI